MCIRDSSSCGDEYRIECFHVQTEADCVEKRDELFKSRRERLEKSLEAKDATFHMDQAFKEVDNA